MLTRPVPAAARFEPPLEAPPDFRLRDQAGRWARPADARGEVLVLTFLFSTCRNLCPAQAGVIRDAVVKAGGGAQVYGVSVDPAGDTPRRARAFLARNGLAGAPVRFLLGSRRELAPVWRAYGIVPIGATPEEAAGAAAAYDRLRRGRTIPLPDRRYVEAQPPPPAAREPYPAGDDLRYRGRMRHGTWDFEHTAYVMLIDKHGRQRVGFPFEQLDADLLARDVRSLLAEP